MNKPTTLIAFATAAFALTAGTFARATPPDLLKRAAISFAAVEPGKPLVWSRKLVSSAPGTNAVKVRYHFEVKDLPPLESLTLVKHAEIEPVTINGMPVEFPFAEMHYQTVPAISLSMLKRGQNVIEGDWMVKVDKKPVTLSARVPVFKARLLGMTAADLTFQTGPILGYATTHAFTVRCRTSAPAEVTLLVDGRPVRMSPAGLLHDLLAEGLTPATTYRYELSASVPGKPTSAKAGPFEVRTYPASGKLFFAGLADCRTDTNAWILTAEAVRKEDPMFMIMGGDLVNAGLCDWKWDDFYWAGASNLLATVPQYTTRGNHEQRAPLFDRLFAGPGGKLEFYQEIGPLLLIGAETDEGDWGPGSERLVWLEDTLRKSAAAFVIFDSHAAPYTSGKHGKLNPEGEPQEPAVRNGQKHILPLLAKYGVQVYLAGHDHFYERSEPPCGVSIVLSGSAGAPLTEKFKTAAQQNPYSKAFRSVLNYALFTIDGDTMRMVVKTPDGEVIDNREWKAREPPRP